MMDSRLWHFIRKEFIQLSRDPRMLFLAIFVPMIQLLVFGYIASTDIRHVSTAVFDEDQSAYSRSYVDSFRNSGYFDLNYRVRGDKEIKSLVDAGKVKIALHIPEEFGKKIVGGSPTNVQVVLDGSNSSAATIISGYINQINFINANELLEKKLARSGLSLKRLSLFEMVPRVWYNPDLKSINYMVPAIFALILMLESMILTAFSIVKEREKGTMEQLIVNPLKSYELILGKLIPFAFVALLDITLVFLVATLWFRVPLNGSAFLLFALGGIFMITGLGLGVFVSTISQTQKQAMMSAVFIIIPSMILSGFIFPIDNMPKIIQAVTYLIPVRYFLVIVRGIFLKGIGMEYLWGEVWPLIVFGGILLTLSIIRFRKKLD